jgi:hypothetical protein
LKLTMTNRLKIPKNWTTRPERLVDIHRFDLGPLGGLGSS